MDAAAVNLYFFIYIFFVFFINRLNTQTSRSLPVNNHVSLLQTTTILLQHIFSSANSIKNNKYNKYFLIYLTIDGTCNLHAESKLAASYYMLKFGKNQTPTNPLNDIRNNYI